MLPTETLEALLREAFPDAELRVQDLTGTRDHYELDIASDRFQGLAAVARHRLVYGTLREHMKEDIHALALRTYTLAEWQKRGSGS